MHLHILTFLIQPAQHQLWLLLLMLTFSGKKDNTKIRMKRLERFIINGNHISKWTKMPINVPSSGKPNIFWFRRRSVENTIRKFQVTQDMEKHPKLAKQYPNMASSRRQHVTSYVIAWVIQKCQCNILWKKIEEFSKNTETYPKEP